MHAFEAFDIACRLPLHEAGHAVVAHALGRRVTSIEPRHEPGGSAAITFADGRKGPAIFWHDFTEIGRDVAYTFGGYVAERRWTKPHRRIALVGASYDFLAIEDWNPFTSDAPGAEILASFAGDPDGWRSFVRAWYRVAVEIVRINWRALAALADELIFTFGDDEALKGKPLRKLLRPVKQYDLGPPRWRWPNGLFGRMERELGPPRPDPPPMPEPPRRGRKGKR